MFIRTFLLMERRLGMGKGDKQRNFNEKMVPRSNIQRIILKHHFKITHHTPCNCEKHTPCHCEKHTPCHCEERSDVAIFKPI